MHRIHRSLLFLPGAGPYIYLFAVEFVSFRPGAGPYIPMLFLARRPYCCSSLEMGLLYLFAVQNNCDIPVSFWPGAGPYTV